MTASAFLDLKQRASKLSEKERQTLPADQKLKIIEALGRLGNG